MSFEWKNIPVITCSFFRFTWVFLIICCCIVIINSILIIYKKVTSRRPVHPIPHPNTLQLSQVPHNLNEGHQSNDHLQETLELQPIPSISRIINVAPINVENNEVPTNESDQKIEVPYDPTNFPSNPVPIPPSTQVLCLNNNKYNRNLISFTGSIILTVTIITAVFFITWNIHVTGDMKRVIFSWYMANFWLSVGLPTLYFVLNPSHLIIAVQDLPC